MLNKFTVIGKQKRWCFKKKFFLVELFKNHFLLRSWRLGICWLFLQKKEVSLSRNNNKNMIIFLLRTEFSPNQF